MNQSLQTANLSVFLCTVTIDLQKNASYIKKPVKAFINPTMGKLFSLFYKQETCSFISTYNEHMQSLRERGQSNLSPTGAFWGYLVQV